MANKWTWTPLDLDGLSYWWHPGCVPEIREDGSTVYRSDPRVQSVTGTMYPVMVSPPAHSPKIID